MAVRGEDSDTAFLAAGYQILDIGAEHHGQVEEGSGRRADGLGIVDVNAGCGQDDGVRAGGVGRAEDGSGVAGVADLAQDRDQLRAGVEHLRRG